MPISSRSDRLFLILETQSNLNLLQNGSNTAKWIECSNCQHDRTLSFIKQLLNKMYHSTLLCHVLYSRLFEGF